MNRVKAKRVSAAAAALLSAVMALTACGSYDIPADKLYSKFAIAANNINRAKGKRVLASDDALAYDIRGMADIDGFFYIISDAPDYSSADPVGGEDISGAGNVSGSGSAFETEDSIDSGSSSDDDTSVIDDDSHLADDDSHIPDDDGSSESESDENGSEESSNSESSEGGSSGSSSGSASSRTTTSSSSSGSTSSRTTTSSSSSGSTSSRTTTSSSSSGSTSSRTTTSSSSSGSTSSRTTTSSSSSGSTSSRTTTSSSSSGSTSSNTSTSSSSSSGSTSQGTTSSGSSGSSTADDASKYMTQEVKELLTLINTERAKEAAAKPGLGIVPLKLNSKLCEAALVRVVEIQTNFGHTRPNGQNAKDYIRQVMGGTGGAGETIAYNYDTAEDVMYFYDNRTGLPDEEMAHGWMYTYETGGNHRNIILGSQFDQIGIAYYAPTHSWVALFYSST